MACPPPFAPPLPAPPRCGWRGGLRCAPAYRELWGTQQVSTSGLHELLRAAGLPREELLHMGAPHWLLSSSAPAWTACEIATRLLGRIAWDARHGQEGAAYIERIDLQDAWRLGHRVIEEWFS